MSLSERGDPKAGPFVNLSQTYCSGLDVVAKAYEPVIKGVGRWNLEVMALATRRARAWLDIPARVSQCKTPQDFAREQLQFWQAAAHDYTEGAQRLTVAFGALVPRGLNGAWSGEPKGPARDYITVAEQPQPTPAETPRRDRRAA